ncbi:hypothetical protein COT72_01405 [archaeon CG10_big_fil_rev_8_21_14_0_10_43_11]|nr:MAG: hypothetical protein COT72_01405 [archaeon CG10_big_fil_rev_8_21_14_0_10_43_11]
MEKRIHIIPLRKKVTKTSRPKRSNRAINVIREYAWKHYRTTHVIIGKHLNQHVWARGAKNPPGKIKVVAIKDADKLSLELEGKYVEKQPEKVSSLKDKLTLKKADKKEETPKEEKPAKKEETKTPAAKKLAKK